MKTIGYYSLIQYCPNLKRMEAINIGLILFVPQKEFMEIQIDNNNERIRKFFETSSYNSDWLKAAKASIQERTKSLKKDLESFEKFINTRMNEIILTNLKPIKVAVEDPFELLSSLFNELVEHRKESKKTTPLIQSLDKAFRDPNLIARIKFNTYFKIPELNKKIQVPYAYQNGVYNIVKPEWFTSKTDYIAKGSLLATEGRFIKKVKSPTNLIIVPEFYYEKREKKEQAISSLQEIFNESKIHVVWPEDRDKFIEEVKQQAH